MGDGHNITMASLDNREAAPMFNIVPTATNPYKLNANFDGLSASYVSDFGNPIKVSGPIFVMRGN